VQILGVLVTGGRTSLGLFRQNHYNVDFPRIKLLPSLHVHSQEVNHLEDDEINFERCKFETTYPSRLLVTLNIVQEAKDAQEEIDKVQVQADGGHDVFIRGKSTVD